MLVLSRKESQKIRLGDSIVITVVRVAGDKVRLGIEAPRDMVVLRDELKPLNPERPSPERPSPERLEAEGLEEWAKDTEKLGKSIEIQVGEKKQVNTSPVSPPLTSHPLAKNLLNADTHCDTTTVA